MITNKDYIRLFITRSIEKDVDNLMLSDKNYVVPKNMILEYVERALSIPYAQYIDYVQIHKGSVNDDQLTQSSSFAACTNDMCRALEWQGNPGMSYVDIGQLFPQYVKAKNEGAFRKYGENQIKTSTQLGLTFEYYGYWYLTCIGYIYNELKQEQQKSLLARSILRIPLYQAILTEIVEVDVDMTNYMHSLSDSTKGRRSGSILRMINICLDECRKEGIEYHSLFYPTYNSRLKQLVMSIQQGYERKRDNTLDIDFAPREEMIHRRHSDYKVYKPCGSMLYEVEFDNEVRVLIHNMMALHEGTTIMWIVFECQSKFQQKYYNMKTNDWRHLICDYIRKITERPNLQENEVFRVGLL